TRSPASMIRRTRRPSSLPLATASRSMSPVEMAGIPSWRARAAACVPLPDPGGPRNTTRQPPSSAAPTDPPALHEPVVVAHHELALDLLQRVHGDTDDDQERGTTEEEVEAQALGDPRRRHGIEAGTDPG